ncbi:alpha/beta hydrolase [Sphingomonas sp. LB2R24]|uniref:alpha/beta hydrolase n=1 Tax=Sphingomonas sorbitolis TaxID=3096165 RepID=UPI002FC6599F
MSIVVSLSISGIVKLNDNRYHTYVIDEPNNPFDLADWVSTAARERFATSVQGAATPIGTLIDTRDHYDAINRRRLDVALRRFDVRIEQTVLGGVPVAMVTPTDGVIDDGALLSLHGGAFMWGAGAGALIEAVPLAAIARRLVIAVDYRLAPEYLYPAAVDDVLRCYHALTETRAPASIGIYGCSAGGVLAAQAVARLIEERLPLPGAIAMLHATGLELGGDSLALAPVLNSVAEADVVSRLMPLPFLAEADEHDPRVFPGNHAAVLTEFPPALLITGTRDFAASSLTVMHRRLLAAGASADLVVFDGMWHAHHVDTDLPEAHETFDIMARFFANHLKTV